VAAPTFNSYWFRLPAGTEIPELRTSTSHTYSNGNGTFTAEITPMRSGGPESQGSCQPYSTGWIAYSDGSPHGQPYYYRHVPELQYGSAAEGAAYAAFDLTPIADSSEILSAQFCVYQYQYTSPATALVTYVNPDSCSSNDTIQYWAICRGLVVHTVGVHDYTGWVKLDLSRAGMTALERRLAEGWATLGILAPGSSLDGASAYGTDGDSLSPRLEIVYLRSDEPDIQALHAELATYPFVKAGADTALLTLANNGRHASGAFWAYTSLRLARESTLVQPIAVGETATVRVALPSPQAQDVMMDSRLWADDKADGTRSNDSAGFQCWSFPASTYAADGFDALGFPPNGWSLMSLDGGPYSWARRADSGLSHSGTGFASCAGESTGASSDWLISSPICPGGPYRDDSVGFFVRAAPPIWAPDTLDIIGMSTSDPPVIIMSLNTWTAEYCRYSVSLDEFDGDTIRVAFRLRPRNGNEIYLDDVWFSHIHEPETIDHGGNRTRETPRDSVQSSSVALPKLAFAQSPASGRFVTVRCSLAVGRMRRLTIRDVAGRAVRTFALSPSGITQLDLRGFPPGVYLATLQGSVPLVSRKLVIAPRQR